MIQTKQAVTAAVEAALNVTLNAGATQLGPSQPKRQRGRPRSQQQNNHQPSAATQKNRLNSGNNNKKNNTKTTKVDLEQQVAELKAELRELKLIVESLKKNNNNNALPTKPNVVQNLKTTNMVVNDAKERERRSKNIIIRGIEPTNDNKKDEEAVKHFLNEVCEQPVAVKKVQRLFKKKSGENITEPTTSILVVLENKDQQEIALSSARHESSTTRIQ